MSAAGHLERKSVNPISPISVLESSMRLMREPRPGYCLEDASLPQSSRSQPAVRRDGSQASAAAGRIAAYTLPPVGIAANPRPLRTVSDSANSLSLRRPSPRSRLLRADDPLAAQSCPQVSTSIESRQPLGGSTGTLKTQATSTPLKITEGPQTQQTLLAPVFDHSVIHEPPRAPFSGTNVRAPFSGSNVSVARPGASQSHAHAPRGTLSAAMKAIARPRAACRLSKLRLTADLSIYPRKPFSGSMQQFVASVAEKFNQTARKRFASVDKKLHPMNFRGQPRSWTLCGSSSYSVGPKRGPCESDLDRRPSTDPCPDSLVLISPEFEIEPNCSWREEVEAMWKYMDTTFNLLQTIGSCTVISLFLRPNHSRAEIKKLAQAILHFEPSFEALMNTSLQKNSWARCNWLDNDVLGKSDISRGEAIALVEMVDVRSSPHSIVSLMQGPKQEDYRWDLSPLRTSDVVRFRGAPGVTNFQDIIGWVQAATSFVQAAMVFEKGFEVLQHIPPTIQGFMCFSDCGNSRGIHRPEQWPRLKDGRDWNQIVTPVPSALNRLVDQRAREIQIALREADRQELEDMNTDAVMPYF